MLYYWDFSKLAKAKYCSAWGAISKWKCYPTVIPAKAGIQFLMTIFLDSSLRWNDIEFYLLSIFIHAFRTNPNEYCLQDIFQNSQVYFSSCFSTFLSWIEHQRRHLKPGSFRCKSCKLSPSVFYQRSTIRLSIKLSFQMEPLCISGMFYAGLAKKRRIL